MNRRLGFALFLLAPVLSAAPTKRPLNVLFIAIDDLRNDLDSDYAGTPPEAAALNTVGAPRRHGSVTTSPQTREEFRPGHCVAECI